MSHRSPDAADRDYDRAIDSIRTRDVGMLYQASNAVDVAVGTIDLIDFIDGVDQIHVDKDWPHWLPDEGGSELAFVDEIKGVCELLVDAANGRGTTFDLDGLATLLSFVSRILNLGALHYDQAAPQATRGLPEPPTAG